MKINNGIVVIVGNNGTSFFAFSGNETRSDFIQTLDDATKPSVEKLFAQFPKLPVYIVLDTAEQSFKRKQYPAMGGADFERVAKRDLLADGDKESFKNFIVIKPPKAKKGAKTAKKPSAKKIDCMFVSCSTSNILNSWLDFIQNLPNRLFGIYSLPLESFSIISILSGFIKSNFKENEIKNYDILCVIFQTKCGGIRQAVYANNNLVFTRIVSYNFSDKGFSEKYYQDLLSTFEYLRRLYIDLTLQDFRIINILPSQASQELMKDSNIASMNCKNCLFEELTKSAGIKNISQQFLTFYDQVFAAIFLGSKHLLKFTNIKIKVFDQFFATLQISKFLNIALSMMIFVIFGYAVFINLKSKDIVSKKEDEKIKSQSQLDDLKKVSLSYSIKLDNGIKVELPEITDIGSFYKKFKETEFKPWDYYEKLSFLVKNNFISKKFEYSPLNKILEKASSGDVSGEPASTETPKNRFVLIVSGNLLNETGELDNLFKKYDSLISQSESTLKDEKYKFSDLPKTFDFNKKYYEIPVDLMIIKEISNK